MTKILVVSDDGLPSGYGRISSEVCKRLVKRGFQVMALSLAYDGILPASYDGEQIPYHVGSLQGKPNWPDVVAQVMNVYVPDLVMVIQDAPYGMAVRSLPADWSKFGFVIITPVDGAPIFPEWVEMVKNADGALTISEFGVREYAKAGVKVGLCRPGINPDKFYALPADERLALRAKLGIEPDAFVFGSMCMNQGRKDITGMLKVFFDFAQDKPTARYLMDMDEVSPAGFHIPMLCRQYGWDLSKLLFRSDCVKLGVTELRERFNVLDVHAVLAFREGYGLPLPEAMACGVVSMAQNWCAGTEVVGEGRGILVKSLPYFMPSTWGGALDKLPDLDDAVRQLQHAYDYPDERRAMAKRGLEWSRAQSWDKAADNTIEVIERALAKKKAVIQPAPLTLVPLPAVMPLPVVAPDGMVKADEVALLENIG